LIAFKRQALVNVKTARQIGEGIGIVVDERRFRANIYLNLNHAGGFAENVYAGESYGLARRLCSRYSNDPRCKMITLDPETTEPQAELLRTVTKGHAGTAWVYGPVLIEGTVARGDKIEVLE